MSRIVIVIASWVFAAGAIGFAAAPSLAACIPLAALTITHG